MDTIEMATDPPGFNLRSSAKFNITGKTRSIRGEDRAFLSVTTIA
jgi:hypothetical protein